MRSAANTLVLPRASRKRSRYVEIGTSMSPETRAR
jgi:hypothetical protein